MDSFYLCTPYFGSAVYIRSSRHRLLCVLFEDDVNEEAFSLLLTLRTRELSSCHFGNID